MIGAPWLDHSHAIPSIVTGYLWRPRIRIPSGAKPLHRLLAPDDRQWTLDGFADIIGSRPWMTGEDVEGG